MQAVVLVGHGSLKKASGAAMIRHAAEVRKRVAPIATAGFLNFSRPTFAEAVERCLKKGATSILVQPYFLIPVALPKYTETDYRKHHLITCVLHSVIYSESVSDQMIPATGYYVDVALAKLIEEEQAKRPHVTFGKAEPFSDHPALAKLVMKRLDEVETSSVDIQNVVAREVTDTAVVLMAHGTPRPKANIFIERVAERVRRARDYKRVTVAYMECNAPTIADAVDEAVEAGAKRVLATPYFLQLGAHVQEDLPEAVEAAKARHPDIIAVPKHTETNYRRYHLRKCVLNGVLHSGSVSNQMIPAISITLTQHLGFGSLLMDVIAARIEEGLNVQTPLPYLRSEREEVNT